MFGISEVSGLPLHPLVVHLPVVLVPLALLGAVAALVRAPWRGWLLPLVTSASAVSLVAVQLAVGSGRQLRDRLGDSTLIDRHEHLALQTRPLVAVFFVVAAAALWTHRATATAPTDGSPHRGWVLAAATPLAVASVLAGGLATTWVMRTGEAGTRATYEGEIGYSTRDGSKGPAQPAGGDGATTTTQPGGNGEPGEAEDATVEIKDFSFGPKEVRISVGGTVTWINGDSASHNAEGRDGPAEFTTKDLATGDRDTVTFDVAGEYSYVCGFHDYMKGTIVVTG